MALQDYVNNLHNIREQLANAGGYQNVVGSGSPTDALRDYYNQVSQWNQQNNTTMFSGSQDEQQQQLFQQQQEEEERRDATDLEKFFHSLGEVGNSMMDATGFAQNRQEYGAFDPRTLGSFLLSLPAGIASAPFTAAEKGFEAATGTDIQTMDENDQVSTTNLDTAQRAAVGLDAGIDAIGTLVGGSGRILGAGFNAGKKALTGEAGGALRGWVTKAGGPAAAQIGADIAEEGGEEFVQSYAEDARFKNLDEGSLGRAIEGAAWGAAGGGIMSGGAHLINRAIGAKSNTEQKDTINDPSFKAEGSPSVQFEREKARNATQQSGQLVSAAQTQAIENQSRNNEIPGSASAINTIVDDDLLLTQSQLGERNLHAMMQANDDGESVRALAKKFHTDVMTLQEIDSRKNSWDRAAGWQGLIDKAEAEGKKVTFIAGRNPDTNATGTAYMDLVRVFDGDGIHMNRHAYMMYGADVDGDKTQIYFGNGGKAQGYLTRNLVSAVTGSAHTNEDYIPWLNSPSASQWFNESIKKHVDDGNLSSSTAKFLKNQMKKAVTDGDNNLAMKSFDDLRQSLYSSRYKANNESGEFADKGASGRAASNFADNAVAETWKYMDVEGQRLASSASEIMKKFDVKSEDVDEELTRLVADDDKFLRVGDSKGRVHFAEFAAELGYKIYANTGLNVGNPFFRQSGQVYYHSKEDQNIWFGEFDQKNLQSIYDKLIAYAFRLSEVGGDVETAIEGLWRTTVQDAVTEKFSGKVDIRTNWNDFIDTFVEVYNERVTVFNNALKNATTRGNVASFDAAKKTPLSKDNLNDVAVAQAFMDVFGTYRFEDIVDITDNNWMAGKTINQGVQEVAVSPGKFGIMFDQYEDFNKFWNMMLTAYGSKERRVGDRITDTISDAAHKIRQIKPHIIEKVDENGNTYHAVSPEYMDVMSEVVNAFTEIIGPNTALRMGIGSVESWIDTKWGQELLSGDENRMNNAILSIILSDQYADVIDLVLSEKPGTTERALSIAKTMAGNSHLHTAIYINALSSKDFTLLKILTDLDTSYEEKKSFHDTLNAKNNAGGSLMADACKTSDGEMSITAVSKRLKRAQRSITNAVVKSDAFNLDVLSRVESLAEQSGNSRDNVIRILKEFASQEYVSMSRDAVAAFVHSQKDVVKKMTDKGIAPNSADMIYQMAMLVNNGDTLSFLDSLNAELGNMTIRGFQVNRLQILSVLFDPTAEIRIWSPTQDGYAVLTQKALFDAYGIEYNGAEPSADNYFQLFHEVPQLMSIIAPQSIEPMASDSKVTVRSSYEGTLDKAIKQKMKSENKNTPQNIQAIRNKIANELFRDPEWWGCFVASIPGIDTSDNLEKTVKLVNHALEKHIDFMYDYAALGDGQRYQVATEVYGKDTFEQVVNMAQRLRDNAFITREIHQFNSQINNEFADAMANDALSMMKYLALRRVFGEEFGSDGSSLFAEILENEPFFESIRKLVSEKDGSGLGNLADSFEEEVKQSIDSYISILYTAFNMLDHDSFSIKSSIVTSESDSRVISLLDKAINDAIDSDKKAKLENAKARFQNFGQGVNGISDLFMFDTSSDLSTQIKDLSVFNLVIDDSCYNWSEKQWFDAVVKIYSHYGLTDDIESVQKDIKAKLASISEMSADEARKTKTLIKGYLNQTILDRLVRGLTFGSGKTVNPGAIKQTIDARRSMIDIADRIAKDIQSDVEQDQSGKSAASFSVDHEIKFHYTNPTVSYMATSAVMNSQSGSIASGISTDGAMVKTVAAFAQLDNSAACNVAPEEVDVNTVSLAKHENWNFIGADNKLHRIYNQSIVDDIKSGKYGPKIRMYNPARCLHAGCRTCGKPSKSASNQNVNLLSRAIAEFCNWMQEPRHLKMKKSMGEAILFGSGIKQDSSWFERVNITSQANLRETLLRGYYARRDKLTNYYINQFNEIGNALGFGADQAMLFANATMRLVEVQTSNGTVYISANDLVSDDAFNAFLERHADKLEGARFESFLPVVMSLQEVSAKITRDVSRQYYSIDDRSSIGVSDIQKWSQEAFVNWDSYNRSKLDIAQIFSGIISNKQSFQMGIAADANPTPVMKFNNMTMEDMKAIGKTSTNHINAKSVPADEKYANIIDSFKKSKSSTTNFRLSSNLIITRASIGSNIDPKKDIELNEIRNHVNPLIWNNQDNGGSGSSYITRDGEDFSAAEIYVGKSASEAEKAYLESSSRGRRLLVPYDVYKQLFNNSSSIPYSVLENTEISLQVSFDDKTIQFVELDPEAQNWIDFSDDNDFMQMSTTFCSPEEIEIAVASMHDLGLADAGHYDRIDYQSNRSFHDLFSIDVEKLLSGVNPGYLATTWDEIREIPLDKIDYSYYEKQDKISTGILKNKAEELIASAVQKTGKLPKAFRNVQRDDCVGFLKQKTVLGDFRYVPIFFNGNVTDKADSVICEFDRGNITVRYSSDSINYSGENSQKLDLYGIAYKSVGRAATSEIDEKWAVLNLCGMHNSLLNPKPEHMFDFHALGSRVIEMNDQTVQNNLYFFSRKSGVNLFFDFVNGKASLRSGLSKELKASADLVNDLCNGDRGAWIRVARGNLAIFEDDQKMNSLIRKLSAEFLLHGGFPHLFFNSRRITLEDGKWVNHGLESRITDFRMVTQNMSRSETLMLFNKLDERLCPPDTSTPDTFKTVFDATGKMINMHTQEEGKQERIHALVGPHYYTRQGTVQGDLSRTAQWSNQHMIKRMMDLGLYAPEIADAIAFQALQTGDYSSSSDETGLEDRVNRIMQQDVDEGSYDQVMYDKVKMALEDPVNTMRVNRYRDELSTFWKEMLEPIKITTNDGNTDWHADTQATQEIELANKKFNDALEFTKAQDKLSQKQIMAFVRLALGWSKNDGRGLTSITVRQYVSAVNRMVTSLEENGMLITGEKYREITDDRIGIPMFHKELTMLLMASPKFKAKYPNGDINAFVEDQYAELKNALNNAKTIENPGKRRALMKMIDAAAYANGKNTVSGHILDDIYVDDLIKSIDSIGGKLSSYDQDFLDSYKELQQINAEKIERYNEFSATRKRATTVDPDGNIHVAFKGDTRTVVDYILRTLSASRKCIGMSYAFMLPANIIERTVNQGMQSIALTLGQSGIGPYTSDYALDPELKRNVVKDEGFRKFWVAWRSAELMGADAELLNQIRNLGDLDAAIAATFKDRNALERFQEKFMNVMSGYNVGIEGQMMNFLDRLVQRAPEEAPWLVTKIDGNKRMFIEQQLAANPQHFMIDLFNGNIGHASASATLARQCMNWAKRGDMAQKNLISAIYSEIAARSAGADFMVTAFVSPYFQYATNRMGRILNWVAPISSLHYLATDWIANGAGGKIPFGKSGMTLGDLMLEDIQVQKNFKEALMIDMLHMGPMLVAFMLLGMAGAVEPPDDEDKWGNFKEWTIFGLRCDVAWWLEDVMGLALPMVAFGRSMQLGKPRLDLITNGIAYYLANNPVAKVSDVISTLIDPMAELYKEYDTDLQGYAKAMGGPPSLQDIFMGKTTSMGLSFVSQFITPGFVREIYNASIDFEPNYKRIFDQDGTGFVTEEGDVDNQTKYTTYQDAIIRKATKNNPVMGLLADLVIHPETGYMAHEMPNTIIYDPEQMNSIEAFSMYKDPWTKKEPKNDEEKLATCMAAISQLQSKSVDQLYTEGFILDYDSKVYISKWIWDQIATLNSEWAKLEQDGSLNYYVAGNGDFNAGQALVSELKQQHYNLVNEFKSLYYDKLWADKLKSPAQYNRRHTTWAQDANGEWYATGYYPSWFMPVTIAPGETEQGYQYVMSREEDWDTESIVTGKSTGERGLVPVEVGKVTTPDISSWSSDGTDTGHSDIYKGNTTKSTTSGGSGYRYSGGRSGGGGGGGRSGGGTNVSYPRVGSPNMSSPGTMQTSRRTRGQYDYLRPSFETKGSREAYRREDL